MQNIALYELGKIIHDERLEEARLARLARSVRHDRARRFTLMERRRFSSFQSQGDASAGCVPCPSPSV